MQHGDGSAGVLAEPFRLGVPFRAVEVDHVTIYRWVHTFTPEFIAAARPARHATGSRWFVDEVRHEGLWIRVGVRDVYRWAVAAGRL